MEVLLVQTFMPIVHTGIDEGISTKLVGWLKVYWWIPLLAFIIILAISYFLMKKEKPIEMIEPLKQNPIPIEELNLFDKPYPPIAKQMRVQGVVSVQVLIDETGKVVSAKAVSGNPALMHAAQQAALGALFSPTKIGDQAVKVSGVITYNFVLQ